MTINIAAAQRAYPDPLDEEDAKSALASTLSRDAEKLDAQGTLQLALDVFGEKIALVSSFGAESAVLLHLLSRIDRSATVIFLDTGKHFEQTHSYRWSLARELGLTDLRVITPAQRDITAGDPNGDLWRRDTDACCEIRKVRPLDAALAGFDAWITGRKQFHGGLRVHLPLFEFSGPHIKVNPLARWSAEELAAYQVRYNLPAHPLVEQGFSSIGCWPCTQPTSRGEDARAGRWRGAGKTECGIHRI
ncbi:MAG: phosphoadenylyl-sulfate reductase [Parvularculaceae bacterium]|nr:phosphoadenylyl-sulfate reductase [Parvularculaceae bacterium]